MPRAAIFHVIVHRMGVAARGLERRDTAEVWVRLGSTKRSPRTKSSNQRLRGDHAMLGRIEVGHACALVRWRAYRYRDAKECDNPFNGGSGLVPAPRH